LTNEIRENNVKKDFVFCRIGQNFKRNGAVENEKGPRNARAFDNI
jgi:hypothetical protein